MAASERLDGPSAELDPSFGNGGGGGTAVWAPPQPTLALNADLPDLDEYEVQIHEAPLKRLVAVVEIVSPANKDRPEHRRQFATKCAALLQRGVSVAIVDVVTDRRGNLYAEVLELFDRSDPTMGEAPPSQYAVELRPHVGRPSSRLETWAYPLLIGRPLPRLPLWVGDDLAVPLELEATYEETCRALRIA